MAPACSPAYACPEVVRAYEASEHRAAQPSHDIWALGVCPLAAALPAPCAARVIKVRCNALVLLLLLLQSAGEAAASGQVLQALHLVKLLMCGKLSSVLLHCMV